MVAYRIPDLWLKLQLARVAAAPFCQSMGWLSNAAIGSCMTPEAHPQRHESTNSRRLTGQVTCDFAMLRNLAVAIERMVSEPVDRNFVPAAQAAAREPGRRLHLDPEALLAPIDRFAAALLAASKSGVPRAALVDPVRQAMRLSMPASNLIRLVIKGVRDRETPFAQQSRERIVYQPDRAPVFLEPYSPLQLVVPPHDGEQWLFAYERRDDEALIDRPWGVSGSWLGERHQGAEAEGALLDCNGFVDVPKGRFVVEAVGIGASMHDAFTKLWRSRLGDTPDWPDGYAETMALIATVHNLRPGPEPVRHYKAAYAVRLDPKSDSARPQ